MPSSHWIVVAAVVLMPACALSWPSDGGQSPSIETAAGASYVFEDDGVKGVAPAITLEGGAYDSDDEREWVSLTREVAMAGDLDGDGVNDLVVMLARNTGGSGLFTYLAPLLAATSGAPSRATLVGDRIGLRAWLLEGPSVRLDVVQAGAEDAMCCPGELATRRWQLQGDRLVEGDAVITGRLGLEAVAGDWRLVAWDVGDPLSGAGVEITLQLADGQASGSSGCNRYTAGVAVDGAGNLATGPIVATRMACPGSRMTNENRYLAALAGATKAGFFLGQLAISYQVEATHATLLFEPDELPDR